MPRKKIVSHTDQRPFTMIYNDFLASRLIGPNEKLVFICLKSHADSKMQCFPSLKTLIKETGLSKPTLLKTLKTLEGKKVLVRKRRKSKTHGGDTSNIYTLYDFSELWQEEDTEKIPAIIQTYNLQECINAVEAAGYDVIKKEFSEVPGKKTCENSISETNDSSKRNYKGKIGNCQAPQIVKIPIDIIKMMFDYEGLKSEYGASYYEDIQGVFEILYDTLNTSKDILRVNSENKPANVVIAKLMKLDSSDIGYAIEQFHKQTGKITKQKMYILTLLYNAKEQKHFDISNQVHHDWGY